MRDNNRQRSSRNFDQRDLRDRENENSSEVLDLAQKEQEHRHTLQSRYLSTFRIGQFFGFIYNIALLYLVYDLIKNDEKILALQIFALNAAIIAFVILTFLIEKRLSSKRFDNRRNNNRRSDNRNRKPNR